MLTNIAVHPVNRVDDFLPWNCATPLPSGVMPSSSNSKQGSRRCWIYAYNGLAFEDRSAAAALGA